MKQYTRFTLLLLTAMLLAVPLAIPEPVQASQVQDPLPAAAAQAGVELVPGTYKGWVFLYADLTTNQSATIGGASIDFNVRAKWKTEGTVNVKVSSKDAASATLKLEKFTVSNSDNNFFGGSGGSCNWYAIVLGSAAWTPAREAGYNKETEDFEFPLDYWGVKEYNH